MSVLDYTGKIKSICDLLGSISINVNEDEMVQVCSASHNGSTRLGRQSWREKSLLLSSTFNQCYWLKRTMSELRPRRWKDICSSQFVWWMRTRLRRQNRSILPISRRELKPSARKQKPLRKLRKKGELPCQTRSANNATYLQLLWESWPPRRRVARRLWCLTSHDLTPRVVL